MHGFLINVIFNLETTSIEGENPILIKGDPH